MEYFETSNHDAGLRLFTLGDRMMCTLELNSPRIAPSLQQYHILNSNFRCPFLVSWRFNTISSPCFRASPQTRLVVKPSNAIGVLHASLSNVGLPAPLLKSPCNDWTCRVANGSLTPSHWRMCQTRVTRMPDHQITDHYVDQLQCCIAYVSIDYLHCGFRIRRRVMHVRGSGSPGHLSCWTR